MVVDDEEFCITLMKEIMHKAGIDVENKVDFCITGEEAVQELTEGYNMGVTYALILTDFSMPVLNGIEATR